MSSLLDQPCSHLSALLVCMEVLSPPQSLLLLAHVCGCMACVPHLDGALLLLVLWQGKGHDDELHLDRPGGVTAREGGGFCGERTGAGGGREGLSAGAWKTECRGRLTAEGWDVGRTDRLWPISSVNRWAAALLLLPLLLLLLHLPHILL
jgi:hypothetical protein